MSEDLSRPEERRGTRNLMLPIAIVCAAGFAILFIGALALLPKANSPGDSPPRATTNAPPIPTPSTGSATTGEGAR
jgi:hypothetical protein